VSLWQEIIDKLGVFQQKISDAFNIIVDLSIASVNDQGGLARPETELVLTRWGKTSVFLKPSS
jgi:hypothetical protein